MENNSNVVYEKEIEEKVNMTLPFVQQFDNTAVRLEGCVITLEPRAELALHKAVTDGNTQATRGAGTGTQVHPLVTKH